MQGQERSSPAKPAAFSVQDRWASGWVRQGSLRGVNKRLCDSKANVDGGASRRQCQLIFSRIYRAAQRCNSATPQTALATTAEATIKPPVDHAPAQSATTDTREPSRTARREAKGGRYGPCDLLLFGQDTYAINGRCCCCVVLAAPPPLLSSLSFTLLHPTLPARREDQRRALQTTPLLSPIPVCFRRACVCPPNCSAF